MKILRFAIFVSLAPILLVPSAQAIEVQRVEHADSAYEKRKGKRLSRVERLIVGKWSGENRQLKWEIERKDDGSFEAVKEIEFDGEKRSVYVRGIWWVEGVIYSVMELEISSSEAEIGEIVEERILQMNRKNFVTVTVGIDGNELVSPEDAATDFSLEFWSKVDSKRFDIERDATAPVIDI